MKRIASWRRDEVELYNSGLIDILYDFVMILLVLRPTTIGCTLYNSGLIDILYDFVMILLVLRPTTIDCTSAPV
jgi:hypothetical protein